MQCSPSGSSPVTRGSISDMRATVARHLGAGPRRGPIVYCIGRPGVALGAPTKSGLRHRFLWRRLVHVADLGGSHAATDGVRSSPVGKSMPRAGHRADGHHGASEGLCGAARRRHGVLTPFGAKRNRGCHARERAGRVAGRHEPQSRAPSADLGGRAVYPAPATPHRYGITLKSTAPRCSPAGQGRASVRCRRMEVWQGVTQNRRRSMRSGGGPARGGASTSGSQIVRPPRGPHEKGSSTMPMAAASMMRPPWPEAARHRMRRRARPCAPPTASRRAR